MRKFFPGFLVSLVLLAACGSSKTTDPYLGSQAPYDPYGTAGGQYPYSNQQDPYGYYTGSGYVDPNQYYYQQDPYASQLQVGSFLFTFDGSTLLGALTPSSDPQSVCNTVYTWAPAAYEPSGIQPPVVWYSNGTSTTFQAYVTKNGYKTPAYDPDSLLRSLGCR